MPDDWRKQDWRSDLPLSDPDHPIYKYVGTKTTRYGVDCGRTTAEVRIPVLGDERLERVLVPAFAMMNFQRACRSARLDTMCAVAALNIGLGGTDEAFKGFTDKIGLVTAPQTDSIYQPFYRWIFGGGSDTSGMITKLSRITEVWAGWPLDQRPVPYDDTEAGWHHWFKDNGSYVGIYKKGFGRYYPPSQGEPFTIHILPRGTPDSPHFALYVSGAGEELDEAPTVDHPAIYLNRMDAKRGAKRWIAAGGKVSDHPIADKPFGVHIVKQDNRWKLYVEGADMSLPTAPTKESPTTFDKEADAEQTSLWWYDAGGVPVEHPSRHNVADLDQSRTANQAATSEISKLAEAESKVTAPPPENDADYIVDRVTRVNQQSPGQWFLQRLTRRDEQHPDGLWQNLHDIPFKTRDEAVAGVPILLARVDAHIAAEKQRSGSEAADGEQGAPQEATKANKPRPVKRESGEVWMTAVGRKENGGVGQVDPDDERALQWTVYLFDGTSESLKTFNLRDDAKTRAEATRNQPLEERAHFLQWGESPSRTPEIGDVKIVGRFADDGADVPPDETIARQWTVLWYVPIATRSTPPNSKTIWPVAYRRLNSFDAAKAKADELKALGPAIEDLIEKSAALNAGDYRIVGVLDLDTPIAVPTGFSGVNRYYAQRCTLSSERNPPAGERVWLRLPVGATDTEYATSAEAEAAIAPDKEKRAGTGTETSEDEEEEDDGSFDWFWSHKAHDPEYFDQDVRDAIENLGEYSCSELWVILHENYGQNIGRALFALHDDSEEDQLAGLLDALMPFVYGDYDETYPALQVRLNDTIEERDAHWEEIGRKNAEITNLKEEIAAKDREIAELKAQKPAAEAGDEAEAEPEAGRAKILELTPEQRAGAQVAWPS